MDAMSVTYHEATKHSFWSVRKNPNFLDWSKQPIPFKIYGDYPLVPLDLDAPLGKCIYYLGGINAKKSYPGVEYYLRTVPSAGALYPTEIYIQMRGMEDFADGIYHFDVANAGLRLLYPLQADEGVEIALRDRRKVEGCIVLFSSIYYRSSWKYKNRAFRYCLLDAGHAQGALEMSTQIFEHAYTLHYDFDKALLNEKFGFRDREFFLSLAIVGRRKAERVQRLGIELPFVDGTGNFEPNETIEAAYHETMGLQSCRPMLRHPRFTFMKERLEEAIMKRRSIREFSAQPIKKEQLAFILEAMRQPIPSDCDDKVRIWYVINRVEGMQCGLYLDGELIKAGDFRQKAGYLCLEQALGSESAVTFFLTSGARNYQPLYLKAGHIGHRCYIASEYLGIGCSGIGAYYDDEVREFLGTQDMVLYALAIGK